MRDKNTIMIDYIKGTITELTPTEVIIETGNIGYVASISLQTYSALDHRNDAKVYIHHILREDEELFYGFATKDERELFRLLIGVSGVGAATARMMLSSLTCDEIRGAIIGEDVNKIKSVKGIGLKSAQRLIIELKDKGISKNRSRYYHTYHPNSFHRFIENAFFPYNKESHYHGNNSCNRCSNTSQLNSICKTLLCYFPSSDIIRKCQTIIHSPQFDERDNGNHYINHADNN